MTQRTRQPLVAVLALMLPILLIVGIYLGGHPSSLPRFLRNWLVADHNTRVINEAIDDIQHDYYRPLSTTQLANSSIAGAVASLHDRFSTYFTPSEYRDFNHLGRFSGIGVAVDAVHAGLRVSQVFDNSPASRAGLRPGDVIVAVSGQELSRLPSGRGEQLIKGPPGTDVQITYARAGRRTTVTITRETINTPVVASAMHVVKGTNVGVVALSMFSEGSHAEVRRAVDRLLHLGAKGLVLDLRGNGGGLVEEARLIASIFIPQGVIVTTRGRTQAPMTLTASGGAISTAIPLAVLVDRGTASASEIVTGALQDHHRATVIGTHTFGKGVFQEVRPLSNGGAIDITVGEYFTPNGRNLGGGGISEGAGIAPDVTVAQGVDGAHGLQIALQNVAARLR
jgi:carboxyl-terminal processing protease